MKYIRTGIVYFATAVCVVSACLLIWPLMFEATVLNGDVLRSWFTKSNVYISLMPDLLEAPIPRGPQGQQLVSRPQMVQALAHTFTSIYLWRESVEVLQAVHDWGRGKPSGVQFTMPIEQRRMAFAAELANVAEPSIAVLPFCATMEQSSDAHLTCRPSSEEPLQFATAIMNRAVASDRSASNAHSPAYWAIVSSLMAAENMRFGDLEYYRPMMDTLIIWLPVILVGCLITIALCAPARLRAFSRLGRWLCIGSALMLTLALSMVYISYAPHIFRAPTHEQLLVMPFVSQAFQGMGICLAVLAGGSGAVGLWLWHALPYISDREG